MDTLTYHNKLTSRIVSKSLMGLMSWLGKIAKSLFIFLFFSYWTYNYKMECGKVSCDFVTMSQLVWWMVTDVTVTVCHVTRVAWGPWESKCIAIVVKCISSRELSKNSIEFSLSNSEQRDSWLNSSHWTLDADTNCLTDNQGSPNHKAASREE